MRNINKASKLVILTGSIAAILTFIVLKFFLDGNIVDIPKGTSKGAIISAVGYIAIITTTVTIGFFVLYFVKKHISKNSD